MKLKKRLQHAFSLIELSIVILLIGIMIAGIIGFSRTIYEDRVKSAAMITQSSPVNSIKNLVLWLETTSDDSFTEDPSYNYDQPISSWLDIGVKSSKTIVTLSDAPSYVKEGIGNLPSLRFTKSEGNYVIANTVAQSIRSSGKFSIFLVAKDLDQTASIRHQSNILFSINTSSGGNVMRFGISPVTGEIAFCGANGYTLSTQSGFDNKSFVYSFVDSTSSTRKLFANGQSVTVDDIDFDYAQSDKFSIGQEYDSVHPTDFFDGLVGEVIVYNRDLKDSERKDIEQYLMQKWSIN